MHHFFIPWENFSGETAKITGEDAYHIARSLRMAEGESVTVCTPDATEHLCSLIRIRDDECILSVISSQRSRAESRVRTVLYQAYPKGDKLELIIQKAVELGVYKVVPFESERCVKRPKSDKIEKQTARLRKIALEAAKQCGRGVVPEISGPLSFSDMIRDAGENCDAVLFCYENEKTESLYSALKALSPSLSEKDPPRLGIIIGSEGGFSISEAKAVLDRGFPAVSLGPRILRCETAAIFALSSVSFFFEQQAPFV